MPMSVGWTGQPPSSPYPRKAFYSAMGRADCRGGAGWREPRVLRDAAVNAPKNGSSRAVSAQRGAGVGEVDAPRRPRRQTTCPPAPARPARLVRNRAQGVWGLYQWIQGTSMAAPHAVGVAAIIVAQRGRCDVARGGLTLAPDTVEGILEGRRRTRRARPRSRSCTRKRRGLRPTRCARGRRTSTASTATASSTLWRRRRRAAADRAHRLSRGAALAPGGIVQNWWITSRNAESTRRAGVGPEIVGRRR